MSYISAYLDTLRNDISLDEDYFEDEIMTYPLYLDVAKKESVYKDQKAKNFYNSYCYRSKSSGFLVALDFDEILNSRSSLMQNFTSSFSKRMIDEKRIMCFTTATILPAYRLSENLDTCYEDVIKNQHNQFKKFHKHIRHDKFNRDMRYFKTFELHKKGDLHMHSLEFLPDNLENLLTYIDVVKRAKTANKMGRIEIRLPYKYKTDIIKKLSLKDSGGLYFENLKIFRTGSGLVLTFFQPDKDSAKDIVSYMMKYTSKNNAFSPNKSNEYYVFRKLSIKSFTYSLGVLPSLVAYQRVRFELINKNKKYNDLYELQKDIDKGLVTFTTYYEQKEPEYLTKCIEKIDKIDKTNDYPIIYTYNSYDDICIFKGSCQLVAIVVSFSDNSKAITWTSGNYERIKVEKNDT